MTDVTATERQARYKERQRGAGLRQVTLWVTDEQAAAIRRYLDGTAPLPVTDAVTSHVTSNVTSDTPSLALRAPEDKAAVLARAWELRCQGWTFQAICDRYNGEGVPTVSGRGIWRPRPLRELLVKARYLRP